MLYTRMLRAMVSVKSLPFIQPVSDELQASSQWCAMVIALWCPVLQQKAVFAKQPLAFQDIYVLSQNWPSMGCPDNSSKKENAKEKASLLQLKVGLLQTCHQLSEALKAAVLTP